MTEAWSFERSETSLSQYVMLNGLQHMLILGQFVRARHQLAKLMYTGALLDWYYQKSMMIIHQCFDYGVFWDWTLRKMRTWISFNLFR